MNSNFGFKKLNAFRSAANTGSFKEASEMLNCVQSAISAQIKSLESELNVRLFERNGRGVELTSSGKELQVYVDRLFNIRDQAIQSIKYSSEISGKIIIAGYESILTYRIPPVIHCFREKYPQVQITVIPASVSTLKTKLQQSLIDVAYIFEESFKTKDICSFKLIDEDVIVVAHPENILTSKNSINGGDLNEQTILFTEKGCNYRNRFERCLIKAGSFSKNHMEFMSIETIKACVKLNTGVGAISRVSVEEELKSGELVELNWKDDDLGVATYMSWNQNRWMSPAVNAFIEFNKKFSLK